MNTSIVRFIAFGWVAFLAAAANAAPAYFTKYSSLSMARDADGILTVTMTNAGKPLRFTAHDHETFVDAFYDIARDRDNNSAQTASTRQNVDGKRAL